MAKGESGNVGGGFFEELGRIGAQWFSWAVVALVLLAAGGWWLAIRYKIIAAVGIPSGAVMAFDLPTGCPDGWNIYKPATARTIIGAGQQFEGSLALDETGGQLTIRNYDDHGGKERVRLRMDNLPPYEIVTGSRVIQVPSGSYYTIRQLDGPSPWKIGSIGPESGPPSFVETMPPFIALYYCRKM